MPVRLSPRVECAASRHWTMHPAFAVVDKDIDTKMLELSQQRNLSLESWSCDSSSHPCIMGHQYKTRLCSSGAQVIINTKGPFSLSLLFLFLCPTIYWLLFLSPPVSSHNTEPGKQRIYFPRTCVTLWLHPIQLMTETSALLPHETPQGQAIVQQTEEPASVQHYSRVALCCCARLTFWLGWHKLEELCSVPCSGGLDAQDAQGSFSVLLIPTDLLLSPASWLT